MLCSQCGKKDAVVMGLCQDCLSGKHNKHKDGISFEEFKERYLQSPTEGLFWADDALLDYAYYRGDGYWLTPQLCGDIPASYKEEHAKLHKWYSEQFYKLLLEKIKQVASVSEFGTLKEFEELFIKFNTRINDLAVRAGDRRIINIILQRFLRITFGRKLLKEPDRYPNPDIISQAAATFDTGSGFYFLDIFFRMLRYDYIYDIIEYITANSIDDLINDSLRPGLILVPWRHQQEAIDAWIRYNHRGVVEMATATGKTLVGMMAIEELSKEGIRTDTRKSVIIACHSRIILNQWRRELIQKLGIVSPTDKYSDYQTPLHSGNVKISFETVQKLSRKTSNYSTDLLIVDEVHHLAGKSFRNALHIDCKWQLGLTAWLGQKVTRRELIKKELGPISYQYTLHQALEDGIIPSFEWTVHPTYLNIIEEEEFERISKAISTLFNTVRYDIITIKKILLKDKEKYEDIIPDSENVESLYMYNIGDFIKLLEIARLKGGISLPDDWKTLQALILKRRLIINKSQPRIDRAEKLIKKLGNQHHVIVFLMDIESCEKMREHLKGFVDNIFVIHSQIEEDPISVAEAFRKSKNGVLIGAQMLNEGIDIKNADIGINLAFAKSEIQLIQRMGRVLRKEGKKRPTFYQFVAIPDKEHYLDIIDADEFADDLAWVESTGLKMGLNLTVEWDDKELIKYKADVEEFWRANSGISKIGTFNAEAAVSEFTKTAIKRIPEILKLYDTKEITDKQWDDIIRTAHTLVDDNGDFVNGRKKRHVNINSAWYILVLCERKVAKLAEFFEKAGKNLDVSDEHELPELYLDNNGIICSDSLVNENNEDYLVDDEDSSLILFDSDELEDADYEEEYEDGDDEDEDDEDDEDEDDEDDEDEDDEDEDDEDEDDEDEDDEDEDDYDGSAHLAYIRMRLGLTLRDTNKISINDAVDMINNSSVSSRLEIFYLMAKDYGMRNISKVSAYKGIYLIMSKDSRSRIVYVGEARGDLAEAVMKNFTSDKNGNWLRYFIGDSILSKENDRYVKTWRYRPQSEAAKQRMWSYDSEKEKEIEGDVTNYMANNFKFFFAEIDGDFTTRKGIQNRLINSLKEYYSTMDLSEWLGSFSTNEKIRSGGMWEIGDQDAGYADEEDLEILFNGADYDEVETFRIYMAYVEKLKRDG